MEPPHTLSPMELVLGEFARLEKLRLNQYEGVFDPNMEQLIKEADASVRQLDPMVREAFRDHPKELAEWEAIMRDYYALDDEPGEEPEGGA